MGLSYKLGLAAAVDVALWRRERRKRTGLSPPAVLFITVIVLIWGTWCSRQMGF